MKHDLNVFTYGYLPLTYWKNWFRNIRQFFRNIKWAWQRAIKGYCDSDLYSLDYFYTILIRDSLKDLAEHHWGYPGDQEFDTDEKWTDYLETISHLMDRSVDREFEDFQYYKNPYEEEYIKHLDNINLFDPNRKETVEEKELFEHYLFESNRITALRRADREKALKMISDRFEDLWD